MTSTPLNVFQRLVRQWDRLHPYNAAQILRIQGKADLGEIQSCWQATLHSLGIGQVRVTGREFRHESLNGRLASSEVHWVEPGIGLEQFITDQLNCPFDPFQSCPFRPFIIQEDDSYYMGVVYQHWVADSASIRLLMHDWFARRYDPGAARTQSVTIPRGGYWHFFGSGRTNWQLLEGVLTSIRWSSRFRRARRIDESEFANFNVRFQLHHLPHGMIDRLHAAARRDNVKLNDLFLAAIAETCNRLVPVRHAERRQDLAIGAIVDLRSHVNEDMSRVFGLFLGFTSVICRPHYFHDWPTLLRSVAAQSAMQKQTGAAQASVVRISAGLMAGKLLSPKKILEFYRKRVPLAAGISNVNLNPTWAAKYHPAPLLDYIRVSPTGPMMPLVFTLTTIGQQLSLGLTYRSSIFSADHATAIASRFLKCLTEVTEAVGVR